MKIAFSGCRDYYPTYVEIEHCWWIAASRGDESNTILVGDCETGVDSVVKEWTEEIRAGGGFHEAPDWEVPELIVCEADWERYRPKNPKHKNPAGVIRNREMIFDKGADWLNAFWDGKSRGTKDCINHAIKKGIPVLIMPVRGEK